MWVTVLTDSTGETTLFGPFQTGKEAQEYGRAYRPIGGAWEARLVDAPRPY